MAESGEHDFGGGGTDSIRAALLRATMYRTAADRVYPCDEYIGNAAVSQLRNVCLAKDEWHLWLPLIRTRRHTQDCPTQIRIVREQAELIEPVRIDRRGQPEDQIQKAKPVGYANRVGHLDPAEQAIRRYVDKIDPYVETIIDQPLISGTPWSLSIRGGRGAVHPT